MTFQISFPFPCGCCGRSGVPSCNEVFLSKGKSPQASSGCQYFRKFQYKAALTPTTSTWCTNVPILCTIPGCTATVGNLFKAVWKYNMPEHIRQCHPGFSTTGIDALGGAPLPPDLIQSMAISDLEEERTGIPRARIPLKPALPNPPTSQPAAPRTRGTKRASTSVPSTSAPSAAKKSRRTKTT